ncbi:MAG TPA: argininosuccinate lyase [Acidobacteriota bacterium]|nr:argininosuccinate lyase [Acidobacteriota bacterium]
MSRPVDDRKKALWAGRFQEEVDRDVQQFTRSVDLDRRLAPYDLAGTRVHVRMLSRQGILSASDLQRILKALDQIDEEIQRNEFPWRDELEDVHMNIEARLHELCGDAGRSVHAGRSRNDQVAVDLKLFCLEAASEWSRLAHRLQAALVERAEPLVEQVFPGWTHLQAAQPLSWAHYLLAWVEMMERDRERIAAYLKIHSVSPLGAGALAGSTLALDPEKVAEELGFQRAFRNSYDVVGDRDFALELSQIAVQIMLHLSRFSEDLIYLSSTAVGWIELPDSLCTGSSMMPQKKNPDVLELVRGKTASVIGHNAALTTLLKGIPTSYHRDLQQDKSHLFPTVDAVASSLAIFHAAVRGFRIDAKAVEADLQRGHLTATDLAEYLVSVGVPFREAHEKVGKLVGLAIARDVGLAELTVDEIRSVEPRCREDVISVLDPQGSLQRRKHAGAAGILPVRRQLEFWRRRLDGEGGEEKG